MLTIRKAIIDDASSMARILREIGWSERRNTMPLEKVSEPIKSLIEHASKEEWLMAGDLLGSGTVGTGCGLEIDKWIQEGDKIELEVERIGKLTNSIGYKSK